MDLLEQNALKEQLIVAASHRDKEKKYWQMKFSEDFTDVSFPDDMSHSITELFRRKNFTIDSDIASELNHISKNNPKALHLILMSAVAGVLSKLTGKEKLIIGTGIYKQKEDDHKLINTMVPMIFDANPSKTFRELIIASKKELVDSLSHQNYPMEVLLQYVMDHHGIVQTTRLFDVGVILKELHKESYLERFPSSFNFIFYSKGNELGLDIRYNISNYSEHLVTTVFRCLETFLDMAIKSVGSRLDQIGILSKDIERQIKTSLYHKEVKYPQKETITSVFNDVVTRFKNHTALQYGNEIYTYGELDCWSSSVARLIEARSISSNEIIAVELERSPVMIAVLLGILKAGACYLPLATDVPSARNKEIIRDSKAQLLITSKHGDPQIQKEIAVLIVGEKIPIETSTLPFKAKTRNTDDIAYIIYTSGTTGKPKGVMISHRNVIRLLFNDAFQFSFSNTDKWVLFHEYNFDFSVWEMYGCLLNGGTLFILDTKYKRDFNYLFELCKKQKITVLNQTPTAFNQFMRTALKTANNLAIRYVIFGGEALKPAVLNNWKTMYPHTKLINMYGITETTVHVTFKEVDHDMINENSCNIGKLLPTLYGYVVSNTGDLLPQGVPGELWIGGAGVAKGYLNNRKLTSTKFIDDPFEKLGRLYKSGDIVRILVNGELEYLGRSDNQIQLGGHRIELGEIENILLKHPRVNEALVVIKYRSEAPFICVYWRGEENFESNELRTYLESKLPTYMVPSYLVKLDEFPMNSNGKVELGSLPRAFSSNGHEVVPPTNKIEETMSSIWQEVLGLESLGITDNYFQAGGDSIIAIKLMNEINNSFESNLPIADLYNFDTVQKLCERLGEKSTDKKRKNHQNAAFYLQNFREQVLVSHPQLKGTDIEDILPMSDIEKGMVYHSLRDPEAVIYHEQVVIDIKYKNFNEVRFLKAVHLMMEKHNIFRTSFLMEKEAHIIHSIVEEPVTFVDISNKKLPEQRALIEQFLESQKKNPFDISRPPIWRMRLFNLTSDYYVLVFELHHAILDGWSQASFFTELNNIYLELKENPGLKLNTLRISYRDLIQQELREKKKPLVRNFWKTQLKDYKRLSFLNDTSKKNITWNRIEYPIGNEFYKKLDKTAQAYNSSVKHLCFAAYLYSIYMLSEHNDILVGLTTNNRPLHEDAEKLIGCFLNTIPIRMKISSNTIWKEYIICVDSYLRKIKQYDKVSLMEIMKITGESSLEENPFFDTKFNFIDFHIIKELESDEMGEYDKSVDIGNFINENTFFDFHINNTWKTLLFTCVYAQNVISAKKAERICRYFKVVLEKFVELPLERAGKNNLIIPDTFNEIVVENNSTYRPENLSEDTISTLFLQQVNSCPDKVAIVFNDLHITYRELEKRSRLMAFWLITKKPKASIIPLLMERSPEMMIAIFAIVRSGMAYLPIDPESPKERIDLQIKDSGSNIILTSKNIDYNISSDIEAIHVEDCDNITKTPKIALHKNPEDLAYVIYTSGSTGIPKGVMIEHRSLTNRLKWMQRAYRLKPTDKILHKTPVTFDVSVWEIFWWALEGATQVILPAKEEKDPEAIFSSMNRHLITTMHFVPSMMRVFLQALPQEKRSVYLSTVFSSGEALDKTLAADFMENFPDVSLANLYGPTEACIDVTYHNVSNSDGSFIPIGRPIDNTRLYVLDNCLEIQDKGVPGELYIAGTGLARGYLNRTELTREKFIFHPLLQEKLYATGDRVYWTRDNELVYLGRSDGQLKIRGVRVEIGEVEYLLQQLPQVDNAAVNSKNNSFGDTELQAFVVLGEEMNNSTFRELMIQKMPEALIPPHVYFLDSLPINNSGKLDRKALQEYTVPKSQVFEQQVMPTSTTDMEVLVKKIWEEILEKKDLDYNTPLFELGGNSISAVRIVLALKSELDCVVHIKDIFKHSTIRSFSKYISEKE